MVKWPKFAFRVMLSGTMMSVSVVPQLEAATSSTLDLLPADRAADGSDSVEIGNLNPAVQPKREPTKALPSGNPLWSVPLSMLSATVARPIFSASRRPPQSAVVGPSLERGIVLAPAPEPEGPALALIGAVVGDGDAIAVFLDRVTQKIVRLRQGDTHAGWQLNAVQGREVTLEKAGRREVLMLQRQEAPVAPFAAGGPGLPASPPLPPQPVAGAPDGSYAPFTPRRTPKNGESDGL